MPPMLAWTSASAATRPSRPTVARTTALGGAAFHTTVLLKG